MQIVQNSEIEYIIICMFVNVSFTLYPDQIWDITLCGEKINISVKLALTDKLYKNKNFVTTYMWKLIHIRNPWLDLRTAIKRAH
jgi:hypothetical protein